MIKSDYLTRTVKLYTTIGFGVAAFSLGALPFLIGFSYSNQFEITILVTITLLVSIATYIYGLKKPKEIFKVAQYEFLLYLITTGLIIHFFDYLNGSLIFIYGLVLLISAYFLNTKTLEYVGGLAALFVVTEYLILLETDEITFTIVGIVFVLLRVLYLILIAQVGKNLAANVSAQRKQYNQLVKLNKQMSELDKVKKDFMDFASHQLKTPLTVVRGNISMVLDGDFGKVNKNLINPLKEAGVGAQRLSEIINSVVDTLKYEEGINLNLNFQKTDIKELIEEELETLLPNALIKDVKIYLKTEAKLPKIEVDKERIKLAISSVIENSLKHTLKEGEIEVSVKKNKMLIVEIIDNGPIITMENPEKFLKDLTKNKDITKKGNLNLYVAKRIIQSHDGEFTYHKDDYRNKFQIKLPINKVENKRSKPRIKSDE